MVAVRPAEIDAALARPDPGRPVVLLFGPDAGLVAERAAALVAALAGGNTDPFAVVRLDGDALASDPGRLADEAYTVALFGGRRVVRVRVGGRSIAAAVEPLLNDPPRDAVVVLEAGDLKRGHALREAVERAKTALAIPCYADGPRDLERLVDGELREAGLAIDRDAREVLLAQLGGDRLASRNEVRKLALYAHGRGRVSRDDVAAVVGDASAESLDEAIDAAFAGDAAATETALGRALAAGTSPQSVIAAALRACSQLHRLRLVVEAGTAIRDVVENARPAIHFRRKPLVERALGAWSAEALARALVELGDAALAARRQFGLADVHASRALLVLAATAARRGRRRA